MFLPIDHLTFSEAIKVAFSFLIIPVLFGNLGGCLWTVLRGLEDKMTWMGIGGNVGLLLSGSSAPSSSSPSIFCHSLILQFFWTMFRAEKWIVLLQCWICLFLSLFLMFTLLHFWIDCSSPWWPPRFYSSAAWQWTHMQRSLQHLIFEMYIQDFRNGQHFTEWLVSLFPLGQFHINIWRNGLLQYSMR